MHVPVMPEGMSGGLTGLIHLVFALDKASAKWTKNLSIVGYLSCPLTHNEGCINDVFTLY